MTGEYEGRSWTGLGLKGAADLVLADLSRSPCHIEKPPTQTAPFVFASPHSGRLYPQALFRLTRLSGLTIRRSEDAYVDQLFSEVVGLGAPFIAARFPRAWLDANRAPGELDVAMFDAPLRIPVDLPGPRVAAGLGVIPRIVRDGADIYRNKLPPQEAEQRLVLHRRYHAALCSLVRDSQSRFGAAVVIDCHSMPSVAGAPDIVLGDRYGVAACSALLRRAEDALQAQGFRVGRNVPYAGGYTTQAYGDPNRGIHALQVEVNRALYLDEERIELTGAFARVRRQLMAAFADVTRMDPALLRTRSYSRLAAE